ncbi:hypothetical protein AXF42_Ash021619 [Apostasia shenzhenica]|uniref:Uncharacterized protein n=1 Tax=Apostasia shenzhenica TaxID=1088818 RepID=A0A2I0A077_9ASPA|nr:hypothetical protein AXF42_Ash021619 [Apostasia shenzhenica]
MIMSIFIVTKLGVLCRTHEPVQLGQVARPNFDHPSVSVRARITTSPGVSVSFVLTSTTSPEIGELTSLVAFTLSTVPKLPPFVTGLPDSGSST